MIDVIVTTYNRLELFKKTMESFFLNTNLDLVDKIIISNDGSTDGTAEYLDELKKQFKKIIVLPQQQDRLGIIPRFNVALTYCTNNIICEFQDDIEFTPGWLETQLSHIDKAHFITGFDAPEHTPFQRENGYMIKHSTRFTQLLARRAIWDQWFPMKPEHPFPTPTFKDGRQIGSNIDTNLYDKHKNKANGKTKFLVVSGLIRHIAENENSTWRLPAELIKYSGGLRPHEVKQYWRIRGKKQGSIAVGFAGRRQEEQEKILEQKKHFILPKIDVKLRTVDYGCGVGHFSRHFSQDKYLGCDITQDFLQIARKTNKNYNYHLLREPYLDTTWDFEQFFTTNVLQHNSNQTLHDLLLQLHQIKEKDFVFSLYENVHNFSGTQHMCFRKPEDYINLVGKYFKIKQTESYEHIVHNETHALIKIWV